jgi:hypothetical protein
LPQILFDYSNFMRLLLALFYEGALNVQLKQQRIRRLRMASEKECERRQAILVNMQDLYICLEER